MSAPVVTFRATGGPQPTSAGRGGPAGAGFSAAYSSGTGAEKSSKAPAAGASGGGGAAAGAQFMNNASQYDDVEVDCSLLPTTLPLTTMAPWLTEPAMVSDEMLHSKKALRKLVRSISTKAAQDILGEHIYAAILRGAVTDKFTPASIGLTKDLVAKLETRRLQENPLAQSQAAESRLSEGQILAAKAQLEASGLPEALNPNLIQHIKKAADFLMPTGSDQLLLFQLPHTFPLSQEADSDMPEAPGAGAANAPHASSAKMAEDQDSAAPPLTNPLAGRQAGRMGKLRIHKSGKVSLMLGAVPFLLTEAAQSNVLHQVVARQEVSDDLYHIGNIDGRLLITPDLEPLLAGL